MDADARKSGQARIYDRRHEIAWSSPQDARERAPRPASSDPTSEPRYLDDGLKAAADPEADDQDHADEESDSDTESLASYSTWDTEREAHEAQLQWDESMRQLQALVNLVAVPWISRYFGRKWAYSLFERYIDLGLGKRFWLGPLARYAPRTWH